MLAQASTSPTPATHLDYADFVRQRKDDVARDIRGQRERSLRIADGIADARVRRAFLKAEAEHERAIAEFWRTFFRRARKRSVTTTARGQAGAASEPRRSSARRRSFAGPIAPPSGAVQLAGYSGPVLDRKGRRGVYLSASYLGAKTATYGCARRLVRYVTDPDHVEWMEGVALCGSNVGDTRTEMSAAFGLVEDLNRAARANSKVVFHLIVQLPHDVTPHDRAEIMRRWCEDQFGLRNLPYVWAVHVPDADGDQRNCHGHVAVSFRPLVRIEPFGWEAGRELKAELDNPEQFRVMREQFARVMTEVAQGAGKNREYTALSHAARGLKIKPTEHLGAHKTKLVREGRYVAGNARNRGKIRRNEALLKIEKFKRRQAAMERRLARMRRMETQPVRSIQRAEFPLRRAVAPPQRATLSRRPAPSPSAVIAIAQRADRKTSNDRTNLRITFNAYRPKREESRAVAHINSVKQPVPKPPSLLGAATSSVRSAPVNSVSVEAVSLRAVTHSVATVVRGSHQAKRSVLSLTPSDLPASSARHHLPDTIAVGNIRAVDRDVVERAVSLAYPTERDRSGHESRALSIMVPFRSLIVDQQAKPPPHVLYNAPRLQPMTVDLDETLIDAAFGSEGRRRRAKAGAPQSWLAATAGIVWAEEVADGDDTFDQVEALDRLERLTPAPLTTITARVRKADFYVHDDGTGKLELDPRAIIALKIADDDLDADLEQAALADIRSEQQRVFALLVAEAKRRPLDFSKNGPRPWPDDLSGPVLARLNRWSGDEGFDNDLFFSVQLLVQKAHAIRDQAATFSPGSPETRAVAHDNQKAGLRSPDGFGGSRDTPKPVFHEEQGGVRLAAFDPTTDRPTDQLLLLLMLTGHYPERIEIATDGRVMATPGKASVLAPLLHPWRHDSRVAALVIDTVIASRRAGKPVWPRQVADAVRAYAVRTDVSSGTSTSRPAPELGRSLSR